MSVIAQNVLLFDWVSITSKIHTFEDIVVLLGLTDPTKVTWDQGYSPRYDCRFYFGSISIHCNRDFIPGIWLEMSGQGCRTFESVGHGDYSILFNLVARHPDAMNMTRLDIAFDDHAENGAPVFDIKRIYVDTLSQSYVSRSTSWSVELSDHGSCVYIGSRQSTVMFRIYDKAAERHCDNEHWIRFEMQLRDARCMKFVQLVGERGMKQAFLDVISNYLRFVDKGDSEDTNKSRWPVADYWSRFIGDAVPQSIFVKPGIEYNVDRCENYVYKLAGNAIDALLQVYDGDVTLFLDKLKDRGTNPNPKYAAMVQNARVARRAGGDSDE